MRLKRLLALVGVLGVVGMTGCGEQSTQEKAEVRALMPDKYRAVEEASQTLCEEEALRDPSNVSADEANEAMEDCR